MNSLHQKQVLNLPNLLTLIRIGSIPILILILHSPGKDWSIIAAIVFCMAGLTDLMDGWIARRMESVTIFGQYLDPLADKLLISSMLIMLTALNRITVWMTIIIICREITVTGMRALVAKHNLQLPSNYLGKWKTVLQTLGIFLLLLHYPLAGFDPQFWGGGFMWLVVFITTYSGLSYAIRFQHTLTEQ